MENEEKNILHVVKMSNHKVPEFTESRNPYQPWVICGDKNDYPHYLVGLFNRSPQHNAIITGKRDFIFGQGFQINKAACENVEQETVIQKRLNAANRYEKLNDVMSKAALDLEISGGFYLQVIYKRGALPGSDDIIAEIYHLDFSKMRSNHDNSEFYFSNDWTQTRQSLVKTGYKKFKPFDPAHPEDGTQVLYFKEYRPELDTYSLPDYIGCIPYIECDYEISNFHLNNIKNSFWGSFMINFYNGQPTEEEKKKITEQIQKKYTGTDNAGKFILNFSDDKTKGADLSALNPPQLDKQFIALENTIQQQIFTGHKITSGMLFGIKTPGQLGGRTEIIEAATLFQNLYVTGKQQKIERVFNCLLQADGLPECLTITPVQPINIQFKDEILAAALTKDEVRISAGYEPMNEPGISDKLPPQPTVTMPKIRASREVPEPKLDQDKLLQMFATMGVPAKDYEVLRSRAIHFQNEEEMILSEAQLWATKFSVALDVDITDNQNRILGILKQNPTATAADIAKALKMSPRVVQDALDKLQSNALIIGNDTGGFDLSDSGMNSIEIGEPVSMDFKIMYKYEVKPGYGPTLIATSRQFCVHLIELDRLYTTTDLRTLSAEAGYDVFRFKGGPYRKPGSNYVSDECRHQWRQQVVITKKK
jgi:hypothetical protein